MIFKIKNKALMTIRFFFFVVFFTGCALKIGEAPPDVPVYYFEDASKQENCSNLNYKKGLKNYFFNLNEAKSDQLTKVLGCFSLQVSNIGSLIYNESFTREELLAVLEDDGIDFQNLKEPLKKILAPEFHQEFSLYKNYTFDLIDPNSELNPSALCIEKTGVNKTAKKSHLNLSSVKPLSADESKFEKSKMEQNIKKEVLLSRSDIDLILNFLRDLQKSLSVIEQKSQSLFKSLLEYEVELALERYKRQHPSPRGPETDSSAEQNSFQASIKEIKKREHQIDKRSFYHSKERVLNFTRLLEESLSDSFPSYSHFLKEQLEFVINESEKPYDYPFYLLEELYPLFQSLFIYSNENRLHLLDIKYLFMMLYSMDFIFKKYDQNKNLMIDNEEIRSFSCLIEPVLSRLLSAKLKGRADLIQNYYRPQKIIRYIFKYQEIPNQDIPSRVRYLFFDPDDEITLSFKEVYRLIHLLFNSGLKELESAYPKEFEKESSDFSESN